MFDSAILDVAIGMGFAYAGQRQASGADPERRACARPTHLAARLRPHQCPRVVRRAGLAGA